MDNEFSRKDLSRAIEESVNYFKLEDRWHFSDLRHNGVGMILFRGYEFGNCVRKCREFEVNKNFRNLELSIEQVEKNLETLFAIRDYVGTFTRLASKNDFELRKDLGSWDKEKDRLREVLLVRMNISSSKEVTNYFFDLYGILPELEEAYAKITNSEFKPYRKVNPLDVI
tara:strand:- start:494 stop:1003 length:510 start_codon:yes stop_codon:yes gene_type:complete